MNDVSAQRIAMNISLRSETERSIRFYIEKKNSKSVQNASYTSWHNE